MPTFHWRGPTSPPIPSFSGTFRGNGHSIRGLAIGGKRSTAGLFLKIGETGEIYDLTVSGNIQSGGDCEAVGGIVGSGLERGAVDTSSTVTGCCSMVRITDCEQYSGAIAGRNAGEFLENPFVSDTLAGIDGQSYGGKAEPIGYDALLETEHLPDEFRTLTLRFEADDAVLTQETFSYGDSFDESVYPELPQKDGYYAQWDKTELEDLRFDTVVSAVYTPYTTAVSAGVRRDNGQDVFLIESDYDDAAQFSAQALAKSTEDFAPISRGFTSAISHYLKSVSWYRLPFTPINRDVEEQWRLTHPQDGSQTHTVHYTPPENEIENVRIYTRQNGSWEQADCESFGDALTFAVSGTESDVAAVTVLPVWWAWLALAVILLAILILLLLFVRKLIRKKRTGTPTAQAAAPETGTDEAPDASSAPAPAKKRRWIWPVILLAVLALAAAYFIFCGGDSLKAYHALETLTSSEKLSMDVTVDAALDADTTHTEATLQRKTVDGHQISYVQIEGVPLYYTDGAVIPENGKAYQIHESFPDYAALLQKIVPLYLDLKAEREDGAWTITLDGETAQQLLQAAVPGLSEDSLRTQSVAVRVQLDADEVEKSSWRQTARCKMRSRSRSRSAWSISPPPRASRCRTQSWTPSTVWTASFPSSRRMCFPCWQPGSNGRTRAARRPSCPCLPASARWSWIRASTSIPASLTENRSMPSAKTAYRSIGAAIRSSGRTACRPLRRKRSWQRRARCWTFFTISARMPRLQKRSKTESRSIPYSWMQTAWRSLPCASRRTAVSWI